MPKEEESIKGIIEELLSRLNVEGRVEFLETADNLQFTVRTSEAGLLIGEGGENLISLNHVARKMVEKKVGKTRLPFSVDVNDYQKQKMEELKDLARMAGQRVRFFKKEVALKPMSSYERRIVHSVLTEYPDIITESRGEDPQRFVVIKPFLGS